MSKDATNTMTPDEYGARFAAAKAVLAHHYGTLFGFWRHCPRKRCRRERACSGDAVACLQNGESAISREAQWDARQRVIETTPAHADPPERMAREFLPGALVAGGEK